MNRPPTRRHLYFIRHGQYEIPPARAGDPGVRSPALGGLLTALGRKQAWRTGKRLARSPINAVYSSDLSRAVETAEIIASQLGIARVRKTPILREQLATAVPGMRVPLHKRRDAKNNLDAIASLFLSPPRRERHDVVVCHGNLIRAVVCCALDVRLTAWRLMDVNHGGITHLKVRADGAVRMVRFNDIGHMPERLISEF